MEYIGWMLLGQRRELIVPQQKEVAYEKITEVTYEEVAYEESFVINNGFCCDIARRLLRWR